MLMRLRNQFIVEHARVIANITNIWARAIEQAVVSDPEKDLDKIFLKLGEEKEESLSKAKRECKKKISDASWNDLRDSLNHPDPRLTAGGRSVSLK